MASVTWRAQLLQVIPLTRSSVVFGEGICSHKHPAIVGVVRRISFSVREANSLHAAMPFAQVWQRLWQRVMAGVEKIFQHPKQVEVHEQRTFTQQKFRVRQHLLE